MRRIKTPLRWRGITGGDEGIPSARLCLRGSRDDYNARCFCNLLLVEPFCRVQILYHIIINKKIPHWGIFLLMAETKGFEPLIPLPVYYISNVAH